MEAGSGEFPDWEVLNSNSDSESGFVSSGGSAHNDLEEFDARSNAMIQPNYFSIESGEDRLARAQASVADEGSESSDNPSWIEPGSDIHYPSEFLSDSGSDRDDYRKFSEFEGKPVVGFEGIEEIIHGNEKISSDAAGVGLGEMKVRGFEEEEENREVGLKGITDSEVENAEGKNVEIETRKVEDGEKKKKTMVWWKIPMELLKYCVFKVNPVWTFSMAAAVMGFVILGRRLYKMKKKTQSLELKVTLDDKKVSQFMSRAARLNEAFSIVKRVPVVRPNIPAVGVTPWPVMSLR